jgi:hypothetical protein
MISEGMVRGIGATLMGARLGPEKTPKTTPCTVEIGHEFHISFFTNFA